VFSRFGLCTGLRVVTRTLNLSVAALLVVKLIIYPKYDMIIRCWGKRRRIRRSTFLHGRRLYTYERRGCICKYKVL